MSTWGAVLRALVSLLLTAAVLPGWATPAQAATTSRSVSLWLPYWQMDAAYASAVGNAAVVGAASPFWYAIDGDSTLVSRPGAGNTRIISGLRNKGIKVIPTVTQSQDMPHFVQMLESPSRRAAHVRTLVALVRSRSFDGLELDYETFAYNRKHITGLPERARVGFPRFVHEVCTALHRVNKKCALAIPARTSDAQPEGCTYCTWVYDYRALGKPVDRIRIMGYHQHGRFSGPGPIASIDWVRRILAYAKTSLPVAKVELGMPAYGFDWSSSGTRSVTSRQALAIAKARGITPTWDTAAREYTYRYTVNGVAHTVWFEERVAHQQRASLARYAGLAGVALWAGGGEDVGVWPRFRTLYTR